MRISPVTLDEISDKLTALSDILNVALELPNQMVAIENAIDRQTEVLERIAAQLEGDEDTSDRPLAPQELRNSGFGELADLMEKGRVS